MYFPGASMHPQAVAEKYVYRPPAVPAVRLSMHERAHDTHVLANVKLGVAWANIHAGGAHSAGERDCCRHSPWRFSTHKCMHLEGRRSRQLDTYTKANVTQAATLCIPPLCFHNGRGQSTEIRYFCSCLNSHSRSPSALLLSATRTRRIAPPPGRTASAPAPPPCRARAAPPRE